MSWYALENLDEALDETKELLLPFDLMTWTKIAIIAVLAGGVSLPNAPAGGPGDPGQSQSMYSGGSGFSGEIPGMQDSFSDVQVDSFTGLATSAPSDGMVIALVLAVVLLGGFFAYVSAVFQFIYYQTILDGKPVIIDNFKKHAYRGLRYFGFQIGFVILVLLSLVIPAAGFAVNVVLGTVVFILVWLPLAVIALIFTGLVHDLALLRMMEHKEGLVQAWRNVWPDVRGEWRQVAVYILVKFFVTVAIAVTSLIILGIVGLTLIIPFGILGLIGALIHPALAGIVTVVGLLSFLLIMLYVRVPFSAYVYTYITLFYHDLTS